ncbi:MAG: acyltransferase [Dehalococcoidia bacterium]|nr:acyltransferase [Dehalococcoidia bacterium]
MSGAGVLRRVRPLLRPAGRPAKRALGSLDAVRLRWIYLREDIDGIEAELRRLRSGHARVLRQFGAKVADDAMVPGPISIVNASGDFSGLDIGARVHVGSEVFFDLAEAIRIEAGATLSMRCMVITHFDAGRGAVAERMPRRTGPVVIERDAYIGAGAIILHGVTIGQGAIVAAGVVADRDVPPGGVLTREGLRTARQRGSGAEAAESER